MSANYVKLPCELAIFALSEHEVPKVCTYAASQFIYAGKARLSDRPARRIANETGISQSTVYRHFTWLLHRNWMGKDEINEWLFFRGFDRVHNIEGWTFARAAIMQQKDLKTFKAFLAGVVCASLAETGKGQRTEQSTSIRSNRSKPPAAPISLSLIADTLHVSTRTASRLRNLATKYHYIRNKENLVQITNWTPNDLKHLKKQDVHQLPVELLGYADKKIVPLDRIRYKKKKLYVQEPNLVTPLLQLKSRRGLSKYVPPMEVNNVRQK